jgi:hypothetical protein
MSMISRRDFVLNCTTALGALALVPPGVGVSKARAGAAHGSSAPLNYAAYAAQLNTVFRVRHSSDQPIELRLVKARRATLCPMSPGRRPPADAAHDKFSLIFIGPQDRPLPSAVHQLEHARLGRLQMHFGEIGARESGGVRYEAVFNQPRTMTLIAQS